MTTLSRAAHDWLLNKTKPEGAKVSIVDVPSGVAASRRTAVGHYVADAAEITVKGETTLVAVWLCGGNTIDGFMLDEGDEADCVGCRLAAAIPQGPVVYYAWGEDDELLYVGSSINAPQRIKAHSSQTAWWPEVRRLTFDAFDNERQARRAELAAINANPGRYNREGKRKRMGLADANLLRLVENGEAS